MKLKKLLAAVTAAALAVSTMAVTSFTASAAALATVPEGTREVLAAADVDYAPTTDWDNGPWAQIAVGEAVMTEENVYVEAKFSGLGGAGTDDGEAPFDDVKSWATILKWYNNNTIEGTKEPDTAQNFEVEFKACEGGTADECFAYAPISDFKRASWGAICGNLQSGHIKGFTLESLSIVKFTASSEEDATEPDVENEWYVTADELDAYYTTVEGGGIPENVQSRVVILEDGKTINDVESVTVSGFVYAPVSKINLTTVAANGLFGLAKDGTFIDGQYAEWTADDLTGLEWYSEEGDTFDEDSYIAFQIDTLNRYNVIGIEFDVVYKEDGGDVEIPEGKKITLAENSWGAGGPENTNWQGMDSVAIEGITNWTTTATEAMEKLDSLEFSFPINGAISNGQVFDVSKLSFQGVLQTADGCWKTFDGSVAGGKVTISIPDVDSALDGYTGAVNIAVVVNTAYANSESAIDVYIGDITVKTSEDNPPVVDPNEGEVLFSGSATANTNIGKSKVAKYKDDAVITVTYTPAATEEAFITAAGISAEEMSYPANTGTIAGQLDADPWWCQPADSAYWTIASSEAFGNEQTFTITVADYLVSIGRTELPYELVFCPWNGTTITKVTIKGDLKGSTGGDDNNGDDNNGDNKDPETPAVTYVPTVNTMVTPYGYTPATDEEIANTVSATAEGDTANVNLTSGTRVEKAVFNSIAGKDVNVEFKLKGGVRWIINGKNVEKAMKVDLGVRLRSKAIPADKVSAVAGDNKTVQFSLRHNGDLGFTGALIIPFSGSYNGKFANLYYYNTAKDELEFVGSSKISGGEASFVFTHASDYVVVIDDEAYGEDVSSAAGVYETSEETSAPYGAAVAVIAVIGAAAVVIRKRLAK